MEGMGWWLDAVMSEIAHEPRGYANVPLNDLTHGNGGYIYTLHIYLFTSFYALPCLIERNGLSLFSAATASTHGFCLGSNVFLLYFNTWTNILIQRKFLASRSQEAIFIADSIQQVSSVALCCYACHCPLYLNLKHFHCRLAISCQPK